MWLRVVVEVNPCCDIGIGVLSYQRCLEELESRNCLAGLSLITERSLVRNARFGVTLTCDFWRSVSYETLVNVTFGGSLARNARFGGVKHSSFAGSMCEFLRG